MAKLQKKTLGENIREGRGGGPKGARRLQRNAEPDERKGKSWRPQGERGGFEAFRTVGGANEGLSEEGDHRRGFKPR